ncbi:hypothetical protein [Streptomyces sp. B6B3]|uniref:hypothetical protein n=1 Tax=Streptomyces sp. B6B3 TaxID=3153570 RepID=UPI00325F506D
MPRKPMPEIPREDAVARYRDKQPMASLARRYGVSAGWLTERFREWGEPIRGHAEAHRERRGLSPTEWRLRFEDEDA